MLVLVNDRIVFLAAFKVKIVARRSFRINLFGGVVSSSLSIRLHSTLNSGKKVQFREVVLFSTKAEFNLFLEK